MKLRHIALWLLLGWFGQTQAENGYELWLRYKPVAETTLRNAYDRTNRNILFPAPSGTLQAAKKELLTGLSGLLDHPVTEVSAIGEGTVVAGTWQSLPLLRERKLVDEADCTSAEGYVIRTAKVNGKRVTVIAAKTDVGVLYGVFRYLRLLQTHRPVDQLDLKDAPKLTHRVLNHWDNLNGTVERGYAGYSIWGWERLPGYKDPRYTDYARANASIGINGTVLNNVNAEARSLRRDWLVKAAGLADAFRPYGIKVYLTAKFSAPKEIGGLKTADPKDPKVRQWWKEKADEIYSLIPDFGGFLVKANSEGQPGPQDYGCTHADGANMLADALAPHGGIVFWRAFVYQNERHVDRVVTGYNEFKPLDGQFRSNVFVQPKNGPIDFQPREPFHPLFGAMPDTPLALEFQITQENLGHAGHLVYLGTLYEETLHADTYAGGKGHTVSKVLQHYGQTHGISALAGVPNIGTDLNWTGHLFGQSNWFAFGRLAWDPDDTADRIAEDWARMTFSNDAAVWSPVCRMMMGSREAYVHYSMPLGLNHIMNFGSHNGPEPWHDDPVWTAFDYHRVTTDSIGVDRTTRGTKATAQYHPEVGQRFNELATCPPAYLLWFHRLPWTFRMPSGRSLWEELVANYYQGVDEVRQMQQTWQTLRGKIDDERFDHVESLLRFQEREAIWWRDGCVLFFQKYSGMPIPEGYERPAHSLKYYQRIPFPHDWNGYYD